MNISIEDLKKYKYVSFDIFDTLVFRNVQKPVDIFEIVEKEANIPTFKEKRIYAEILARKNSLNEEITLDEIYENLEWKELKNLEIQIEKSLIVKNKEMYELYEKCLKENKKVIITSDMYLPLEVIKDILHQNGITKYEKIYLSSELKVTKSKGSIWEYILKDLNISKESIIHIGDNEKSDFLKAKNFGINALVYKRETYNVHTKSTYNNLNSFIKNNIDKNKDYFWKIGYETFGPLLYSYAKWLEENFLKENYEKIFFLSRDGYIMQKAFNIINNNLENEYLYASRRALIVPTIWMYESLEEVLKNMYLGPSLTVNALLKKLGLNSKEYIDILKKYNLELDTTLNSDKIISNKEFMNFYNNIKEDIYKNSKEEYKNLQKYFEKMGFSGNVAIVDIGWFGNMQNAIEKVIKNAKITGYYVGIIPNSKNQLTQKMKGFLFEKNKNEDLYLEKKFFNSIFEMIFMGNHGSVKKYAQNEVCFYDFEYENTDTFKNIESLQQGALKFVEDFNLSPSNKYIKIDERISMYNMLEFGNNPRLEDTEKFGDMCFYDEEEFFLAKPKKLSYYIVHPKEFFKDFKNSVWMPGFLKRTFRINLPYFKFILIMRKLKRG